METVGKRLGILGNADSWYVADLQRATRELGVVADRLEFPQLVAAVSSSALQQPAERFFCAAESLENYSAIIVRTMPPGSLEQVIYRMDVLQRLEAAGITVFNSPRALECAVDKYLTTARLAAAGLPVPETIVCEGEESALAAFEQLGGDVVVKPLFGAEGRGIVRVSDPDIALRTFRTLSRLQAVLYLQRFIQHPGYDVRVMVLDGRILGAIQRHNPFDFRTNLARQGAGQLHELTDLEAAWARRAAEVTGARCAGIDLLYDQQGACYVIEVNAVPGWRGFAKITGMDVARAVVEAVLSSAGSA